MERFNPKSPELRPVYADLVGSCSDCDWEQKVPTNLADDNTRETSALALRELILDHFVKTKHRVNNIHVERHG